jgi:membrane associated rhomboid family serine protease
MRLNIPPVTRVLLGLIIAISLLYNTARWTAIQSASETPATNPPPKPLVPYLALVPGQFYPWTLLTSPFVEQNIVTLGINGAAVYFGGRYLERAWGSREFALVLLVTSLIPNILAVPTYWIWGAITANPSRVLTPITGGITMQAAYLVAFKQLVPEHTVSVYKGMIKMRVKHFPAIFLALNTISGLILGTDTALILAWLGLISSWTYLRFYKRQPEVTSTSGSTSSIRGDASETFAFATFFPDVAQPPIAAACNQIFELLCTIKLCTPFSEEAIAMSNEQAAARGEGGLPTFVKQSRGLKGMSKREEAERRRALALRALDQRLNNPSSSRSAPTNSVTPNVSGDQEALGQTDYRPDDN